MNILTISGSANKESSNQRLLKALPSVIPQHEFVHFEGLMDFPLFTPERDKTPSQLVVAFKESIRQADIVIISFPEYIHNIPAVLKNALEWVTASGELYEKKAMLISYTPSAPRGEKAMKSLIWSLDALSVKVLAQISLYQSELKITEDGKWLGDTPIEEIKTVFDLIT